MTAFATAAASLLTWWTTPLAIAAALAFAWTFRRESLRAEAVSRRHPPLPPAERSTR